MLTLRQAAAELGITPDTLRQQIKAGALRGRKVGPIWTITRAELERYRRDSRGKRGRRPDKKSE
jgi:excisionase family DNA binding protein